MLLLNLINTEKHLLIFHNLLDTSLAESKS